MAQISTVEVPCLVLQLNNTIQIDGEQLIGKVLQVPCRNDFQDDPNYWFVPVKDSGIFTTFTPVPAVGDFVNPPTYDSIKVFRVRDKQSGYTWWIYGTNNDFVLACSTCCGTAAIPMPGIGGVTIRIQPCDTLCIENADGNYYSVWGIPSLGAGEKYYPYGSYDNVALPSPAAGGYSSIAALLVFLNANWTNVGSPNETFVYTSSADGLTLIATGGALNHSLCISIYNIIPSP